MTSYMGVEVFHMEKPVYLFIFLGFVGHQVLFIISHKEHLSVSKIFDVGGTAKCPLGMIPRPVDIWCWSLNAQALR